MFRPLKVAVVALLASLLVPIAACHRQAKSSVSVSDPSDEPKIPETKAADPAVSKLDTPDPKPKKAVPLTGPYPRRLLAIGVSKYIYANPVHYGTSSSHKGSDRRDFYWAFEHLASAWKIPKDQVFFISDGPLAEGKIDEKRAPTKSMIEGAFDRFLESSRAQDRVIIAFAGHAIEKNGEAYLVPLEGQFNNVATLIPVKDLYAKINKCQAQEKLIILDVCRFNPEKAAERPSFGVMTPALEKALHRCPTDAAIWTSCSAGEYSYEFESNFLDVRGLKQFAISGSIFLNMFGAFELRSGKSQGYFAGDQHDPLPTGPVSEFVTSITRESVKNLTTKQQTPKITSNLGKRSVAFNPSEKRAKQFEYPTPTVAKNELVAVIFKEIGLPPIKATLKTDGKIESAPDSPPIPKDAMKDYGDDSPTFEIIEKSPASYKKQYPFRFAVVTAFMEMRRLPEEKRDLMYKPDLKQKKKDVKELNEMNEFMRQGLPEMIPSPIKELHKKVISGPFQHVIATRQLILEEQKSNLEEVAKFKAKEKSKRWQAHYDYAYAQVRLRLAYVAEYNLALGKVKSEQLPALDAQLNQKRWRLTPSEKFASSKEIRDMAEEARNSLDELGNQHPNTPWAVLGKSQRGVILGLKWEASN